MKLLYKNQKIKILSLGLMLACMATLGVIVQSCNNEMDGLQSVTVDSKKANAIAAQYLELQGNQYVFNLSEEQALSLGISKTDYDKIQVEVVKTNAFIIDCQAKGIKVDVNDPQKNKINSTIPRLKSDDELITPGCYFEMPETGAGGGCTMYVPLGARQVQITVTTPCPVSGCSGTVSCGGVTTAYAITGVPIFSSFISACSFSTTVNLVASNTYVTVTGNTPCSGGGTVSVVFLTPK